MESQTKFVIEAQDKMSRQWQFDGICTESVEDCAWDSAAEAELVVHEMRTWGPDWSSGTYRIVEVTMGAEAWPGYTVDRVVAEFPADVDDEEQEEDEEYSDDQADTGRGSWDDGADGQY